MAETWSSIEGFLAELHTRYASVDEGDVATYIPELAKANPDWFGISLATTDGHVYEVGDSRQAFTIQSISKPFTYGLALEDRGRSARARTRSASSRPATRSTRSASSRAPGGR